ncbi:MAG TPA: hypothetical protein VMS22_11760 [Candidatus Eisenbacteria bacterium]|nr:hypothetical protein [Candidatus Eisenbacteria bacterium]
MAVIAMLWIGLCLILRHTNFKRTGEPLDRNRNEEKARVDVIQYHNHAIYGAFEFYFTVTLSVLGGMAYIALRRDGTHAEASRMFLAAGGWILWGAALVFSSVIFMHQKSKIERWRYPFKYWEPLLWVEFPLIAIMFMIAAGVRWNLLPELVR